MQQIVKLGAAADADLLLLVDSAVVLVPPVTMDTFRKGGRVRFYRSDGAVDEQLPRHLLWHDVARRLLGLPPARLVGSIPVQSGGNRRASGGGKW